MEDDYGDLTYNEYYTGNVGTYAITRSQDGGPTVWLVVHLYDDGTASTVNVQLTRRAARANAMRLAG